MQFSGLRARCGTEPEVGLPGAARGEADDGAVPHREAQDLVEPERREDRQMEPHRRVDVGQLDREMIERGGTVAMAPEGPSA